MNEYYDFFKDFAGVTEKDLQLYKCGGKAKKKACGGIKMKKMEDGSWFNKNKPSNVIKKEEERKKEKEQMKKNMTPNARLSYDLLHSDKYYKYLRDSSKNAPEEGNEEKAAESAGKIKNKKK